MVVVNCFWERVSARKKAIRRVPFVFYRWQLHRSPGRDFSAVQRAAPFQGWHRPGRHEKRLRELCSASSKRISFRFHRRHRCPHTSGPTGPPLDLEPVPVPKLSRTNEEYGPIPLDRVERPVLYRLNTELKLNEGAIESTTAYRSEFEEKHAERQNRSDILFFKTNTF